MQSVQLQYVFYKFIKVELHLRLNIQGKSVQIWMDLWKGLFIKFAHIKFWPQHLKTCLDFN